MARRPAFPDALSHAGAWRWMEKKLRVMLDWTLDLAFSKDLVQFLGAARRKPVASEPPPAPASRQAVAAGERA